MGTTCAGFTIAEYLMDESKTGKTEAEAKKIREYNDACLRGLGPMWVKNIETNRVFMKYAKVPSVAELFDKWAGEPVIVCGAGPSFHEHLSYVKRLQKIGWRVVVVDRALTTAKNAGIKPDLVVVSDGKPEVDAFLQDLDGENIAVTVCADSAVVARASLFGNMYMYMHATPFDSLSVDAYRQEVVARNYFVVRPACVVTFCAVDIAVRAGCTTICVIGNELGWHREEDVEDLYRDRWADHPEWRSGGAEWHSQLVRLVRGRETAFVSLPAFVTAAGAFAFFPKEYEHIDFLDFSGGIMEWSKANIKLVVISIEKEIKKQKAAV